MSRLLTRRSYRRIALVALFGMLWAQAVIASHGLCLHGMSGLNTSPPAAEQAHGCHEEAELSLSIDDAVVCAAHCSQSDQISESAQVPVVAALHVDQLFPRSADCAAEPLVARFFRGTLARRHWPTTHPGALLLI